MLERYEQIVMTHGEALPLSPIRGGVERLKSEFHDQAVYWAKRDETSMAVMFEALSYESLINPELDKVLEDTIALRLHDDISTSEIAGTWRVALFEDQLELEAHPDDFESREDWIGPIRDVVTLLNARRPPADQVTRVERLRRNLVADPVCTSPYTRANPDELLMQSAYQRFPDGFVWIDAASGMVTVPNQILQKQQYAMAVNELYSLERLGNGQMRWLNSPELTRAGQELLSREHLVKLCIATDIVDPYNSPVAQGRAMASLRSSERRDIDYMLTYIGLAAGIHPLLKFKTVDFTCRDQVMQLKDELDGRKASLITMGTVQHQLSREKRQAMDANAKELLAGDGLISKKDFFRYSRSQGITFYKNWHQWGKFRNIVYDAANPGMRWQEFCRNGDSRCLDIAIGTGKLVVGGSLYGFDELVLRRGDVATMRTTVLDLGARKLAKRNAP
jgi:hypothetical protein